MVFPNAARFSSDLPAFLDWRCSWVDFVNQQFTLLGRRQRRAQAGQFIGRKEALHFVLGVVFDATAGIRTLGPKLPFLGQFEHL